MSFSLPFSATGTGSEPVLHLSGLSKSYARVVGESLARGRRQVLADVGLTIRRGEIYGFVGLNGAGKTTTIKIALGLTHPDAGTVRLFGGDLSAAACARVGYAPEKPGFASFLTGLEVLEYAARLLGCRLPATRFHEVLERVGLWDDRGKQVANYSKGMQQRLALAAAMLHDPDLYVLDEPSSGLDPLGRRLVKEILKELRRAGRTVFFSTHILADVREICDRIGVIHQGRMVFEGTLDQFNPTRGDLEERFVALIGAGPGVGLHGSSLDLDVVRPHIASGPSKAAPGVVVSGGRKDHASLPSGPDPSHHQNRRVETTTGSMDRAAWAVNQSLAAIGWIGWYGFLEAVRSRLLLGTMFLVLPLMVSTWMLDPYQVGLQVKVVKDLGLNLMSGFGLLIVLFASLDQIIPDIERRTIAFVLTRVGNRQVYILGRFLGVALMLAFFHTVMAAFLTAMLRWHDQAWFWEVPLGAFVIFLKQCVLVAVVLFLTTFATRLVVISLSVLAYVLGHTLDLFRHLAERRGLGIVAGHAGEAVALLLPDFSLFELKMAVVHEFPVQGTAVALLSLYTLCVTLFYLAAGGTILARRDL